MDEMTMATLEELRRLRSKVQHELASTATVGDQINSVLDAVVLPGCLSKTMILGDIVFDSRNNTLVVRSPEGLLLQAALGIGYGGLGAVIWKVAEYERSSQDPQGETNSTAVKFRRFNDCPAEIRSVLLPFMHTLVNRFIERVQTAANAR